MGGMLMAFLVVFLGVVFVEVSFDEDCIYTKSPWRGAKRVRWEDILSASYMQIGDWHVLETATAGKLRVSRRLSNLKYLGEALLKRGIISPDQLDQWRTAGSLPHE